MIRIYGVGREKKVKLPEDANLITVAPRVQLGNIIDFDSKKSRRNMRIGYYDAMRAIYGLGGRIYYIEENQEECYYLKQLIDVDRIIMDYLLETYHMEPAEGMEVRTLIEVILPALHPN